MVYSIELLSTENDLNAQAAGTSRNCATIRKSPYVMNRSPIVSVVYNGQRIEDITGPTPFIDFSTNVERTEGGVPNVRNNKIVLTGKIVRGGSGPKADLGSGIKPLMSGINDLKTLFDCNECGILEIECVPGGGNGYNTLFTATGVRVVDLSFSKSDDNWIFTSDYSITLEYLEPSFPGRYVRSYSDSWNIEQLEDQPYTFNQWNVNQKVEWDNPNALSSTTQQQTQSQTGANAAGTSVLTNFNIPRYKVSRTVSAVGIPSGVGYCKPPPDMYASLDYSSYSSAELDAFTNAKAWVEDRVKSIISPYAKRIGEAESASSAMWSPLISGYLYNHIRSVKFDIQAASYEITDTFLAMPTGIGYTEDYTIEITTDNKFIHTLTINGEIVGLSVPRMDSISHNSVSVTGHTDLVINNEELHLNPGLSQSAKGAPVPPIKPADYTLGFSKNKILSENRYDNALSGWLYDIKPYLYRRACAAMNSIDRNKPYINPVQFAANKPPNNPIYSTHGLLNIIPISTTEGHDTRKGKITYSHQFNNKFTIISGALYESVSINTNGPADVISEAFVLGRQLGPILQDLGSKTSTKKTVSIEVGVVPPSTVNGYFLNHIECPLWTGGSVYSTIDLLVSGLAPYGDRDISVFGSVGRRRDVEGRVFVNQDDHSWNPSEGVYSRNISWTYQPCTNKQSYLDN